MAIASSDCKLLEGIRSCEPSIDDTIVDILLSNKSRIEAIEATEAD